MIKQLIILAGILLLSINERITIQESVKAKPLYEQVWKTKYHDDFKARHSDAYVYQDVVLVAQKNSFAKKLDYNIGAYDKRTGKLAWSWNHPNPSTVILDTYGYKDLMMVRGRHSLFVFHIPSQSVLWEIATDEKMRNIGKPVFKDGIAYVSTASTVKGRLKKSEMRAYDVYTGQYEVLYTETEKEVKPYRPSIGNITFFKNKEDRALAVFEVRYIATKVSPRASLPDLVCIDMKTKEVRWRKTDYNELASGNNTIKFHKGKLYNTGDWSLYAFDPETGDRLNRWEFKESYPLGSFNNADFTIVNDIVYTLDDLGHLNGINTVTEDFEFSYKKGAANTQSPPTVHGDFILFSSFGHQAIEIFDTQKQLFVHKGRQKAWGEAIVYDEESDLYFTTTDQLLHAFRLNSLSSDFQY